MTKVARLDEAAGHKAVWPGSALQKVVIVHDFANAQLGAGATRSALDTALALRQRGVEVEFFAAAGEPDAELLEAGVRVTTLGQADIRRNRSRAKAALQGFWNGDAAQALEAVMRACDLDRTIFHVHTWSKALSPSILPLLTRSGVHSVFHLHEYFAACPNGGFFDYGSLSICERTPLGASCLTRQCDSRSGKVKAWRVARHTVMRRLAHYPDRAKAFVLLSKTQRKALEPYLPGDARMVEMRNPIAVSKEPRQPRDAQARYLFVGRISKEKGLGVLVEGFADSQEALLVLGDGPDLEWLKAQLPRAEFRGWQTKQEVQAAMRSARALVFPSLWYEGMPMVVLEALACGTPVISSQASSAKEVLVEGATGLLFDHTATGALARARDILADDAMAETMSEKAYAAYWAQPCDMGRYADATLALYEDMLNGGETRQ
ncbi:glycosyltransferase family 4 protein [Novosphingobium mangrovi (ex Hu et al. 2023)]|uniref:Glycosyltransferase family 4 protein n=1 Tax=Novosphingobium mangrovi (ex Hu et al. 2023) TaxID=2930094 RepID=A0ABT0ACD0_9SPHN|nr:glycosyltransferase family 4 protein [Novosphingobium mangrovi (ex Hu et al. 2023)]MCJ1960829.1 glycosyltransferase family 4 protein [Novosphingobium mangrovi (ex Hu et al. 2023)]